MAIILQRYPSVSQSWLVACRNLRAFRGGVTTRMRDTVLWVLADLKGELSTVRGYMNFSRRVHKQSGAEVIWQFVTRCLVTLEATLQSSFKRFLCQSVVNIVESRSMSEHILRLNLFGMWTRNFFYGSQQMDIIGKNNYCLKIFPTVRTLNTRHSKCLMFSVCCTNSVQLSPSIASSPPHRARHTTFSPAQGSCRSL
jgi:hypothetical protein